MRLVLGSLLLPSHGDPADEQHIQVQDLHELQAAAYLSALIPWCLAHRVQMLCLKYAGSANALYPLLPLGDTCSGDTSLLLEPAWVSQPPWSCSVFPWM